MPTFTTRFLNVTSMRIRGQFSLDDMAERMNRNRPNHDLLEGGWASVDDEKSNIGVVNAAPPESDVEMFKAEEIDGDEYPERLVARYYYFLERKGLREAHPDASEADLHEVAAIDITISRISNDEALLLVSARDLSMIRRHPLEKLALILDSLDPKASIDVDTSPLALPSPDVYLWLMVRARDSNSVDDSLEIRSIEAVHGQDSAFRVTVLNDSVSFDRPGFLIAVAEGDELGPAKITVFDEPRGIKCCFQLWSNGMFSVITGSTYYPDEVDTATWRIQSVFDLAYRIIPRIVAAYEADTNWAQTVRGKEIIAAAQALADRYSEHSS